MAGTYTPTTARTDLVNAWKETYLALQPAIRVLAEELDWFDDIPDAKVDWSTYQTILPLDIYRAFGFGAVSEGGYKTRPSSKSVERATIDLQHYNVSFTMSELANWADKGLGNQVKQQIKLQGTQKFATMARGLANYLHGTSVGTLFLTDTDIAGASTATLTLHSGYGNSAITDGTFMTNLVEVGDQVALVDGSSLVANSIPATITAKTPATPSIAISTTSNVTVSNNNLKVVLANSLEEATLAGGSDYNKGLVGVQDWLFSTTVHGKSSSSITDWSVARGVSSGGRYTPVKHRALKDAIYNEAPPQYAQPNRWMVAQGVYRDAMDYQRVGLRFEDAMEMTIDGDIKSKGLKVLSTKRVMPGLSCLFHGNAVGKIMLTPMPDADGGLSWSDGEKLENRSAKRFDIDVVVGTVCRARKAFAYETGLTEQ